MENQEKQTDLLQKQYELLAKIIGMNPTPSPNELDSTVERQKSQAYSVGAIPEQLEDLKQKRADGTMTDEEYQAAKIKLLGKH